MQDNAPSHAAHLPTDFLKKVLVKKGEIMEWPDLNPIKNLHVEHSQKGGVCWWKAVLVKRESLKCD